MRSMTSVMRWSSITPFQGFCLMPLLIHPTLRDVNIVDPFRACRISAMPVTKAPKGRDIQTMGAAHRETSIHPDKPRKVEIP